MSTENNMIKLHKWSHPNWDMKLILKASQHSVEEAKDYLDPLEDDASLLICEEGEMNKELFDNLAEFGG